jgi:RHS repeat-associated protein
LFTGRETDILDNGSLKIQNNRNRSYEYSTGRWLQQDPLGIVPNDNSQINSFEIFNQYERSLNLYEFISSNPVKAMDPYGLWESDVHYDQTKKWARFDNLMSPSAAEKVAFYDNYVDTWKNPVTTDKEVLSWHFSMPHDPELYWGPTDSRFNHSEDQIEKAIELCKSAAGEGSQKQKELVGKALEELGKGLHPLQDWAAHGTWIPLSTKYHILPFHPGGTDDKTLIFKHSGDGFLRDWADLGEVPKKPYFTHGFARYNETKNMTLDYLNSFKRECSAPCKCFIYGANN